MNKSIIIIGFLITSWTNLKAQSFSHKPEYSTLLNQNKGKELMAQCTRSTPQGITGFWNITISDKEIIENNFEKILSLNSTGCEIVGESIPNLNKYSFQYIGITIGLEKYIYINAFTSRDSRDEWKTQPVGVCDGGKGYWGALFNIDSLEFSQLQFNSEG